MKKVVLKQECETINLSKVTNDSIVGIKWKSKRKGFVVKLTNESFVSIGNTGLSTVEAWSKPSVKQYIEQAFKEQEADAFVFEGLKELYKWLAED